MDDIVGAVKRVTDIMGEIAAASEEQSSGIRAGQPRHQPDGKRDAAECRAGGAGRRRRRGVCSSRPPGWRMKCPASRWLRRKRTVAQPRQAVREPARMPVPQTAPVARRRRRPHGVRRTSFRWRQEPSGGTPGHGAPGPDQQCRTGEASRAGSACSTCSTCGTGSTAAPAAGRQGSHPAAGWRHRAPRAAGATRAPALPSKARAPVVRQKREPVLVSKPLPAARAAWPAVAAAPAPRRAARAPAAGSLAGANGDWESF
ncbi:hypothetical protein ACU4GD_01580 [Cupriavidus basilensis]